MYTVFYISAASRQLRRLPDEVRSAIQYAIEALAHNPRTIHTEKLESPGNVYRLRVSDYRVLYTIEDRMNRVIIYRIRHRREVYR